MYNSTLTSIYYTVAPVQTRWINHRPWAPWYSDELRKPKQMKRKMERSFRKSKLTFDKELFVDACERYNSLLETTKTTFYRMKIEQIDSKKLFYNIDAMFMHKSSPLPAKESVDVLVESFNNFFIQKIDFNRHSLLTSQDQQTLFHDPGHLSSSITHSLSDFHRSHVQSIISTVKSLT